jgi:uncharacterized protein (DUF427 family)
MGLAWQQGPLATGSVGHFLTPQPLPERLLFAEPLRRRMRVRFAGQWIADSQDVVLLHEPGRYPVAFFPRGEVRPDTLVAEDRTTHHRDLGDVSWFTVRVGEREANHAAWQYSALPPYAAVLNGRVAFGWRAMDAFYEEDERIVGHAADPYHRIDIRATSRHIVVRDADRVIADTRRPLALYESGFAPRWYVPREDVQESALKPAEGQTFCPYKGLANYYDIGNRRFPRRHTAAARARPSRRPSRHRPRTRSRRDRPEGSHPGVANKPFCDGTHRKIGFKSNLDKS